MRLGGHRAGLHRSRGLVELKVVHLRLPAHDRLPQSVVGIHHDRTEVTIHGIDAEGHACDITGHHLLDHHRHAGMRVVKAVLPPVGDGAVMPEGKETSLDLRQHFVCANHIEEGIMLAREGSTGQILQVGGGTHRVRLPRRAGRQGLAHLGSHGLRERCAGEFFPQARTTLLEANRIPGREIRGLGKHLPQS